MTVTLSLFAGAGAQFFDDSGVPLAGGKIYTYAAGTTTPLATYTSLAGNVFHTNPIILDSAGRVNEIWLPIGVGYKFVLKNANDVLIATYDNIPSAAQSPAANDANSIFYEQGYVVSAGDFVVGSTYEIYSVGTTDFTLIGAPSNSPGVHFIATGVGSGSGTAKYSRSVQQKFQDRVSVTDFGADPTGTVDSSTAILAAFDYIRNVGGGTVDFPNFGNSTYLSNYGFVIPTNCIINLNGCTLRTTTTWNQAQPTPPTNATYLAFFAIMGSATSNATLATDLKNIEIIGDNAVIDMRYDEQTGVRRGSSGILIQPTPLPGVDNLWKLHDIIVKDVTVKDCLWYSFATCDAKDVIFQNCKSVRPWQLGFVTISGWNVSFVTCEASYSRNGAGNQGVGFWNEANETWQILRNIRYYNCVAEYNNRSGYRYYNDGKDVEVSIVAVGNISRFNQWNPNTNSQYSSTSDAGHVVVNKSLSGLSDHLIKLIGCVAEEEYGAGFKVIRVAGGSYRQNFLLEDCVAFNCNKEDLDAYATSPFHVSVDCDSRTYISNPLVIAPSANVNGYGIGLQSSDNVFLTTPRFVGMFTYALLTGNVAGLARKDAGWDVAWDDYVDGHTGGGTRFYKPVRLASWDQTNQPVIGTDTYTNELAMWQTDANEFVGLYTRDDSNNPAYLDFRTGHRRLRAVLDLTGSSATISAQGVETQTLTVTGAVLGDYVEVSYTVALNNALILQAQVTAADTVTVRFHNPSSSSVSRVAGYAVVNVMPSE